LDLYDKGQRTYEFLNLKLVKPKTSADRQANREIYELACKIRAKREYKLNNEIFGFVSSAKSNTDFIAFFQKFISTYPNKNIRMYLSALQWLQKFVLHKTKKNFHSCQTHNRALFTGIQGLS
jgi:hypothetical protein